MDKYLKNINAIKKTNPEFANYIKEDNGVTWVKIIHTQGYKNLLIEDYSVPVLNYDSDPDKVSKEAAKEQKLHNDGVSIVVGIGLGYYAKNFLDAMDEKHVMVVIEPTIHILKIALKMHDFSKAIKSGQLLFCVNEADVSTIFSILENGKNIENWHVTVDKYVRHKKEAYDNLLNHVFQTISSLRCQTGTVVGAGKTIADNDLLSLPYVIQHRGVAELVGLFKNKPALIICTGPSLEKNIHHLMDKKIQNRFIIIAVGQALRILLSYDIKPDFITSVDYGPVNLGHYLGLFDIKDIPLVAMNRSYAPILQQWKGPKFITISPNAQSKKETIVDLLQHKGGLLQGGSVAHMSYGLAEVMECDPIIFMGMDLAYEGNLSHMSLADESGNINVSEKGVIEWEVDDPRSKIQGRHVMSDVRKVPAYLGGAVNTNVGLLSFITNFEQFFKHSKATLIDATEGGAHIKGTKRKAFIKIKNKYSAINKSILKPLLTKADDWKSLVKKALKLLDSDMTDLEIIISESKLAMKHGSKALLTSNRKKIRYHLEKNHYHSTKASKLAVNNPLINLSIVKASRQIMNRELSVNNSIDHLMSAKGRLDLKTRIKRNRIIHEAAIEACQYFLEQYDTIYHEIEYLKIHGKVKAFKSINPKPSLKDADSYYAKGNWGRPLLEARKIISMFSLSDVDNSLNAQETIALQEATETQDTSLMLREYSIEEAQEKEEKEKRWKTIEYLELIEEGRKVGYEDKDLEKANELLKKAHKLFPNKPEALWGLATILNMFGNKKESIKKYTSLIKKHPDSLQFQFELATVYLGDNQIEKANEKYKEIFKKTKQYDWFLKSLSKIYFSAGMIEEALTAITVYLEKFPYDPNGWEKKLEYFTKKTGDDCDGYEADELVSIVKTIEGLENT